MVTVISLANGKMWAMTPTSEELCAAFWSAADALMNDETVHDIEKPYFDERMGMIDTSGGGMPKEFWQHMADQFTD